MNTDRVFAHRGLILTALKFYKKRLEKIEKDEEEAELDTDDTKRKLGQIEVLCDEFKDQRALLLENTPMGDALVAEKFTAPDGTVLTADRIDDMLTRLGIDAPFEFITGWTLEQRQECYRFIVASQQALLDGSDVRPELPEFVSETWIVTDGDAVLEREMSDEDVDKWVSAGPWGVRSSPGATPADDEWELVRHVADAGDDIGTEIASDRRYGQLDRARLIAANLNVIEEGKSIAAAWKEPAPASSEPATEPASEPATESTADSATDSTTEEAAEATADATT